LGKLRRWLQYDIAMQRGAPQFVVIAPASRISPHLFFAEQSRTARRFSGALDVVTFFTA